MTYNILYKGRPIYKGVTEENMKTILFELSEKVADEKLDSDLIDVEEVQ